MPFGSYNSSMQASPPMTSRASKIRHWLVASLFLLALAAAFWRAPQVPPATFPAQPGFGKQTLPAVQQAEMLPGMGETASTPSLTRLSDGRLACAWTSSTKGKYEQSTIWFSTRQDNGWSTPQAIANREYTAGAIFAHIQQIDSPIIHQHGEQLHLWYTATGIGGSQTRKTIIHSVSGNDGLHWSTPSRLPTTPFGNSAMQLRAPPVALNDGGLALPVTQHFFASHGEWLRLAENGRILDKTRMPYDLPGSHPTAVALDETRVIALLQDGAAKQIRAVSSHDGGQSWRAVDFPKLPNPGTPIAVARLPSGRLLLAGNTAAGRGSLALWTGDAEARDWRFVRTIESATDATADFSEPSLLSGKDGWIHLVYSWRGQGVRYMSFSEAWLDGANQ